MSRQNLRVEAFGAFGYRGLSLAASFLAGVIIARALGPEGKGLIAFLFLCPYLLTRIVELGINGAGVHELRGHTERLPRVHANVLVLVLFTVLAGLGFMALGGVELLEKVFPDIPEEYLIIGLALTPAVLYVFVWQGLMTALGRQRHCNRLLAIVMAFYPIGCGALILLRADARAWAYLVVGLVFAQSLVAFMSLRRLHGSEPLRFEWTGFVQALRFGFAVYIGNVLMQLLFNLDQFVVANRVGLAALGFYSISATLAGHLRILNSVVAGSVLKRVTGGSADEAVESVCVSSRHAVLTGLGAATILLVIARPFIGLFYSEAFLPAVTPLLLLLPGVAALGVATNIFSWIIYRSNRPYLYAVGSGIGFAVHLGMLFLLLDRMGIRGAAIASSSGYLAALAAAVLFFRAQTGSSLRTLLLPGVNDLKAYGRLTGDLIAALRRERS